MLKGKLTQSESNQLAKLMRGQTTEITVEDDSLFFRWGTGWMTVRVKLHVVAANNDDDQRNPRCMCESSLCDHTEPCKRPVDSRFMMHGVVDTCTQCASNMCASGGSHYITYLQSS